LGLVNSTYLVTTEYGIYVFQQLNPVFSKEVTADHFTIARHLNSRGFIAPNIIQTQTGDSFFECEGEVWKACVYLSNDNHVTLNDNTAVSASKAMARLHLITEKLDYRPVHVVEHFHDTPHLVEKMKRVFGGTSEEFREPVRDLLDVVISETPKYFLGDERRVLIHGDPKFDNILFVHERAVGMLDFDTCMIGSPLLDIGDAFRSWCRNDDNSFNEERFRAIAKAYRENSTSNYTDEDMLKATALITLELASRYLTDYVEECYFAWNPKYGTKREQNRARAERYVKYFENMKTQMFE